MRAVSLLMSAFNAYFHSGASIPRLSPLLKKLMHNYSGKLINFYNAYSIDGSISSVLLL